MEAIRNKNQEELRKAREELFRELDKGIRDMEQGNVTPHEETMRMIYAKFGLKDV